MADLRTDWADNIGMKVDAAFLNALDAAVNANTHARTIVDTFANRPAAAASNNGAFFKCKDSDAEYVSNGSAWTKIRVAGAGGLVLADPPAMTSFNLGTSTLSSDRGDRVLTVPSVVGDNVRGEYQTLSPASGYTATAYIDPSNVGTTPAVYTGLLLGNSAGAYVTYGISYNSAINNYGLHLGKWTSATAFSAAYLNAMSTNLLQVLPRWIRLRDDGTNRIYEYSIDNIDWNPVFSVGRTDFLTPDRVGWFAYNTSGSTIKLRNRSFAITNP